MINVLIVEDSRISREAFEQQMARMPDYHVVTSIENAANAVIVCMRGNIDLILMDVCTADDESGLSAAARIKHQHPEIRIIIMTSMPEYSFLQKARDYGCDGFWYKEQEAPSLKEVCDSAMHGEFLWPENTPVVTIGNVKSSDFTSRELEVTRCLALGATYEETAELLHISLNTIKYHVKNILQKTGFHSMIQLVAEVVEKRLILPKY